MFFKILPYVNISHHPPSIEEENHPVKSTNNIRIKKINNKNKKRALINTI
jgi:hypothetical protein